MPSPLKKINHNHIYSIAKLMVMEARSPAVLLYISTWTQDKLSPTTTVVTCGLICVFFSIIMSIWEFHLIITLCVGWSRAAPYILGAETDTPLYKYLQAQNITFEV